MIKKDGNRGRGNGRPIVKYRDTLQWAIQKWLNRIEVPVGLCVRVGSRNHVLHGVQMPHAKGQFLGERHARACLTTLSRELCRNGWTDQDAVWVVDSDRPKEACVTLAPPVEYDWTVLVRRWRGLLSNYFDHLLHWWSLLLNRLQLTSSSAIAGRPHYACWTSNRKPVKKLRIRHCWRKCVESAILRGWVTSRLIFRLKG